jgi:hypothetical protein
MRVPTLSMIFSVTYHLELHIPISFLLLLSYLPTKEVNALLCPNDQFDIYFGKNEMYNKQ